jgi:tripartite-type tricarboxylate transporter receptor subunit TctC
VAKIQDIISYAKANPGKLRWATSDPGSAGTLSMHMFRLGAGLNIVIIPYKGAGPASVAVVSGEADLMFANPAVFMPQITAGRLRAIATASAKRLSILPDMPTFEESGMPGFESVSWYGLAAPAHTPQHIIDYQYREVSAILKQPEVSARIIHEGGFPGGNTPQEFAQNIRSDIAKWAKVIKEANIKL